MTAGEAIVLVHGLWMPRQACAILAWRLRRAGFSTTLFGYPTIHATLAENAQRLKRCVKSCAATRVHVVAHSLGGLVALQMLAHDPDPAIGRLVLLGSPVRGSAAARALARHSAGRRLLGAGLLECMHAGFPIGPLPIDVGVIAGDVSLGLGRIMTLALPTPNDGAVGVSETLLPWAADQIIVRASHSSMLVSARVAQQTVRFLKFGKFLHA